MQVNRIATMTVETARLDETVERIAQRMAEGDTGFLPVVDAGRLLSVITDRDVVIGVLAEGKDPRWTTVDQVMSHPAWWIYEDAEHEDACRTMIERGVRRLVVCDHRQRPTGVLSINDLALFGHGDDTVGRVLEHVVALRTVWDVLG